MIFTYNRWEWFCEGLSREAKYSITAREVLKGEMTEPYIVLKHDVETDISKAYRMAKIESQYGHRGTYYVQAYLLDDPRNVDALKEMQNMGHEISYHYDVMDSTKGDIQKAIVEFEQNQNKFAIQGFTVETLCQHGNPVIERVGYTSNRDFFRNEKVQQRYPNMADVMVDFPNKAQTSYSYFSDAGRKFKKIYDPFTNDIINSDDKNIVYDNLEELFKDVAANENCIISTHPHRWENSSVSYLIRAGIFKCIKVIAKIVMKIPFAKRIMSRYYYLAKKV